MKSARILTALIVVIHAGRKISGRCRMKTEILYEDKDIFVIRKPAGLATQTAKIGQQDVVSELKKYLAATGQTIAGQPYLGIIHRLDQPVEGLLVFAKNKKASATLTAQLSGQYLEKRQKTGKGKLQDAAEEVLNKRYYAVFCGKPDAMEGTLVDNLYKDAASGRAKIMGESDVGSLDAKRAILHYQIQQTVVVNGEELSLADIQIETGRFHQIRAQMAHAGMALLGDGKYAGEELRQLSGRLGICTVALCAYHIALVHPVSGKKLEFQIEPSTRAFSFFSL